MYTPEGSFTTIPFSIIYIIVIPSNEQICKTEAPAVQWVRQKMTSEQEWQYWDSFDLNDLHSTDILILS